MQGTEIVIFITIIMIIITLYIKYQNNNSEVIMVKSELDGKKYLVRNLPDKKEAADVLALTRSRLETLCQKLRRDNGDKKLVKLFLDRFNPENISENTPGSKYTSYSVNKGEKIVLCLRAKDGTDRLIDVNTLLFVTLHECAHLSTNEIGHTPKFWQNFKFLLNEAITSGIYIKQDFKQSPQPYCGIYITDSPLDDDNQTGGEKVISS